MDTYGTTRKKRRGVAVILVPAVVLVLVLGVILALGSNAVKYLSAMVLMGSKDYAQALEQFEALPGYQQADHYADLCTHHIAVQKYDDGHYAEAAELFAQLGDFENSEEWYQFAVYEAGHACFKEEEYDLAWTWFDKLEGQYPENGLQHFLTYEDAVAALHEADTAREGKLHCYVANMPEAYRDQDYLWESAANYLFHRSGTVTYDWDEKRLYIDVVYYPSEAILEAWRTGDDSNLTEEEKTVLSKALGLVEQAKAENPGVLETELWLHDWLCENIRYDNPNMDVPSEEYLKLRQLTCVGALMDGKANCQGYTDAFYLLGTMAGMEVGKLSGDSEEPHTWNTVCLEDIRYVVDVTFDDMESDGPADKTYIYFNCPLDLETYQIDGDATLYADVAQRTDPEVTYYGYRDCAFESLDDAVLYLLRQHAQKGNVVTYAMVTDAQLDSDDLYSAIERNMDRVGLRSVEWDEYITCYGGNTYLTLCWK